MRCYTAVPRFYCGVDWHARTMDLGLLAADGQVGFDQNVPATAQACWQALAPFRDGLVVAVACRCCWYGLADRCAREQIALVLGHALYRRALHGGKRKND
jgi:hypothetical protein